MYGCYRVACHSFRLNPQAHHLRLCPACRSSLPAPPPPMLLFRISLSLSVLFIRPFLSLRLSVPCLLYRSLVLVPACLADPRADRADPVQPAGPRGDHHPGVQRGGGAPVSPVQATGAHHPLRRRRVHHSPGGEREACVNIIASPAGTRTGQPRMEGRRGVVFSRSGLYMVVSAPLGFAAVCFFGSPRLASPVVLLCLGFPCGAVFLRSVCRSASSLALRLNVGPLNCVC